MEQNTHAQDTQTIDAVITGVAREPDETADENAAVIVYIVRKDDASRQDQILMGPGGAQKLMAERDIRTFEGLKGKYVKAIYREKELVNIQ